MARCKAVRDPGSTVTSNSSGGSINSTTSLPMLGAGAGGRKTTSGMHKQWIFHQGKKIQCTISSTVFIAYDHTLPYLLTKTAKSDAPPLPP